MGLNSVTHQPRATRRDGPRPVNLQTDLGALADLIEMAFADTMDAGGRAAIREMRQLGRLGPGLGLLGGLHALALGYVWEAEGRVVGNVSVYPAHEWPRAWGRGYIIANVATDPAWRGRGIATQLMEASLALLRARGASVALLQVDTPNMTARRLYERLGFVDERDFIHWRRRPGPVWQDAPAMAAPNVPMARRQPRDAHAEHALAQALRPQARGGVGWLVPTHRSTFHPAPWAWLAQSFALRRTNRFVVRAGDGLAASLWVDEPLGSDPVLLTLMARPDWPYEPGWGLLAAAVRRLGRTRTLLMHHPADDTTLSQRAAAMGFKPTRHVTHMRWQP